MSAPQFPNTVPPQVAPVPPGPRPRSTSELIARLGSGSAPVQTQSAWRRLFRLGPSAEEQAEAGELSLIRAQFGAARTIMVAQPKGGAGKTPTALDLAAEFGIARGGGVVAWDNNELQGTMAERSYCQHRRDVSDVLAMMHELLQPDARVATVQHMLNYQAPGQFWTLLSSRGNKHQVSREDFDLVHEVLCRFFAVVVVDTGNNQGAPNWRAALAKADVLVVPIKWRNDSLIPAQQMVAELGEEYPDILRRMIVVGTNGPSDIDQRVRQTALEWFQDYPIIEVPTDPHIDEGGVIDYSRLRPATRAAYRRLAAVTAQLITTVG